MSELPPSTSPQPGVDRRTLLRGVAVAGGVAVTGSLVTACGSSSSQTGPDARSGGTTVARSQTPTAGKTTGGSGGGNALGAVADVPVGGGKIYAAQQVVVTQPESGVFRGFSAICTHAGCPVTSVTATINCPCHGSQFSIADGSVVAGPAPQPLPAKDVAVSGPNIVLR